MPEEKPPPQGLILITPVTTELPAWTRLWRFHRRESPSCAFRPFDPAAYDPALAGRFDPTPQDPYPYLYAGLSAQVTLIESVMRDSSLAGPRRYVPKKVVSGRDLSEVVTSISLKLISLITVNDLASLRQDEWLVRSKSSNTFTLTREWASYLRAAVPDAQGFIWRPGSLLADDHDDRYIVLFGDRLDQGAIQPTSSTIALDTAEGIKLLNEYLAPRLTRLRDDGSRPPAEPAQDAPAPAAEADDDLLTMLRDAAAEWADQVGDPADAGKGSVGDSHEDVQPGRPVSVEGSSGVQVGDHNTLNIYYGQQGAQATGPIRPRGDGLPYRGLTPFEVADYEFFFGRDAAVAEVMEGLSAASSGIFAVSGASGSGKSSLLRAGLLPRLRRDGLPGNPGAKTWPCLLFTPGATPLDELAAQMAVLAGISVEEARRPLAANPQLFRRLARQVTLAQELQRSDQARLDPSARQRLVLVIDQFEQVFSLCQNEGERRAFITALESAAMAPDPSLLVVLGVRADFEGRCAEYPQLAAAMQECYRLGPMTGPELELAITEPAKRAGADVQQELIDCLLAESRDGPGALPWLSYALAGSWRARTGDRLTLADYHQAGETATAVTTTAQRIYDGLTERQKDTLRRVFLQLTRTGDGTGAIAVPATWDELYAGADPVAVRAVLDTLANERVVTLTSAGAEISYAALPSTWPLLRDDWLAGRHRRDLAAGAPVRVLVDIEERQGEHFIILTGPGGLRSERQVAWMDSRGKHLLVSSSDPYLARNDGLVSDPAALAGTVGQGRATEAELALYGRLLFEAGLGQELWQQLVIVATGQPYLELAIRGADSDDQVAMQALCWEALHDGTRFLAVQAQDEGPWVSVVRLIPETEQPVGSAARAELRPVDRVPRVLFAVTGSLTDPATRAGQEFMGVMRRMDRPRGSIHARILERASGASLLEGLRTFRPDVLYLTGHVGRSDDYQVTLDGIPLPSASPATEWAGNAPRLVILSIFQTASAGASPPPGTSSSSPDRVRSRPLAAVFIAAGVPIVIEMAGSDITDAARRAFTVQLMTSIVQGLPLAQALSEGRQAVLPGPAFASTRWALPTAFFSQYVRGDAPLVDTEAARAVRERISLLGLGQESALIRGGEFAGAMDRLLDGGDPLNVLFAYEPENGLDHNGYRLLRELAAHAVRSGVLPVLLGPYDQAPPSSLFHLADQLTTAIGDMRAALGLRRGSTRILAETAYENAALDDLAQAARLEFADLVESLPEADPVRARANGQPQVVLLCHAVDGWLEASISLLDVLGPMGLSRGLTPIPVVLTGADFGVLREARLTRWSDRPWVRAIPLNRALDEDDSLRDGYRRQAEVEGIRALVAAGAYQEAEERLASLAAEDSGQAGQLQLELGFLSLPEPDRRVVAAAWMATGVGRDVQSLLAGTGASAPASRPGTATTPVAEPDPQPSASAAPRRPAQQSGAVLEQATVDLFARFFAVDSAVILSRLRRQAAGTQFGHDIELECTAAGSPVVRCHVECKNLSHGPTVDDISGKLTQQKLYYRDAPIDHWILISPHRDVANDLRRALDIWERQDEYPFSVQVWSPENRIREMFALEPPVYQAVYGQPPTADETGAAAEVTELIRQRLVPRWQVDAVWRRYLKQPGAFCFVNEDSRHFDGLYRRHLPLKAVNERREQLDGTLMDQVIGWAGDGSAAPMLLLADFGEGKSVFTYCLTRRLAEEFRAAPDVALFPLRIPLREFKEAGSARGLLERRLGEIGATLADWRTLTRQVRTLAVLDGFDEMTADLSPAAITANLRDIRSCLTELAGSRVLVTSRQRVLDGSRDWKRTLNRMGDPVVMRIGSGERRERVRYLEQFATDEASARVLANLRSQYDPIGLAAKPLFLEMIKETLRDLPDDTFSETILYDTYIGKSLRAKWELLADPDEDLTIDELIENLMDILEDVAVRLQEANSPYLYLRDYQGKDRGKIAELLWKMRDQAIQREPFPLAAQDDAANRVGIRSLLKAVPAPDADRWPVDFFHRSMREYFVARSIAHSLATDTERARHILGAAPLLPEVAHFAATILRARQDDAALDALEALARSATASCDDMYLGGNALTLLHGAGGLLAGKDWAGLRLDHARLWGANLQEARLAGSSLRHANLDNANLENADLTGADLEGVRLEETSQVLAVTALGASQIIAAYEDRSLREWRGRPGAGWGSRVVATLDHKANRLQVTPRGRVMASGEGMLSVLDVGGGGDAGSTDSVEPGGSGETGEVPGVRCAFRTSSRSRAAVLGARTALFAEEGDGGQLQVTWLDMTTVRALDELDVDETVTACAQLDEVLFALATPDEIRVVWPLGESQCKAMKVTDPAVTCLAIRADGDGALLAAGHQDGSVSVTRLRPADTGVVAPQWRRHLHDGPVTDILLDEEEQVITGSTDRSVCVTPVSAIRSGSPDSAVQRLHLTLRCKGVRFDGVRTEHEQQKLRQYTES